MEPTRHFGTRTGTGLKCPSFVADVKSYPIGERLELLYLLRYDPTS